MRQPGWRVKRESRRSVEPPIHVIAVVADVIIISTSSYSKSLLWLAPVGMGAKASISPFPPDVAQAAVARGMGEAQPVGEADRPHVHGRAAS